MSSVSLKQGFLPVPVSQRLKQILNANAKDVVEKVKAVVTQHNLDSTGKGQVLTLAAKNKRLEVVKALVDMKANIDCLDEKAWGPLHYASDNGDVGMAAVLLEKGANVNQKIKVIVDSPFL